MSTFPLPLTESDKAETLMAACNHLHHGESDSRGFEVTLESFDPGPEKPIAYWVGKTVLSAFYAMPACEGNGRLLAIAHGLEALIVEPMKTSEGVTK